MTVQEFLLAMKYTKPVMETEHRAIRRVMNIKELGFSVTHADIDRELEVTRHAIERATELEALTEAEAQAAEVERDTKWLDSDMEREDWQADAKAEAEFDADTKWTQECAL